MGYKKNHTLTTLTKILANFGKVSWKIPTSEINEGVKAVNNFLTNCQSCGQLSNEGVKGVSRENSIKHSFDALSKLCKWI